uniref:Putative mitochondrial chaperone BCS1-B n=1 Tax=Aegilops tauschii TaxID=37682 RepID=N1QPN9_AEGTA
MLLAGSPHLLQPQRPRQHTLSFNLSKITTRTIGIIYATRTRMSSPVQVTTAFNRHNIKRSSRSGYGSGGGGGLRGARMGGGDHLPLVRGAELRAPHLPSLPHHLGRQARSLIQPVPPDHHLLLRVWRRALPEQRLLPRCAYLSDACARHARKLKAELGKDSKNLLVSVDDHEEVTDDFSGITIWWYASKRQSKANVISLYPGGDEKRFYRVVFHRRPRALVVDSYLREQGILCQGRQGMEAGYLLYGPPGTGKSTMIDAMANFLDYGVYDLELTAVKNNTELRKLFIETTGKSIIIIEDIDCSVDFTGKRHKDKASSDKDSDNDDKPKLLIEPEKDDATKLTLSGLLNFIDGLWMDKHIEMSYCSFEGFKVLAKNYLDVIEHELFGEVQHLLEETDMSPTDVAENLMPMSKKKKRDPDVCLIGLIEALKQAKEEAAAAKVKEAEEAQAKKAKEKEETEVKKAKEEDKEKDKAPEAANGDIKQGDK